MVKSIVNVKEESFYKYSKVSLKTQPLRMSYWYDGYAICSSSRKSYWLAMPCCEHFILGSNVLKCASISTVNDSGTLESIKYLQKLDDDLSAMSIHPVSWQTNNIHNTELMHVIIFFDSKAGIFLSVPAADINVLFEAYVLPTLAKPNTISTAYNLTTGGEEV